MTESEFLEKYKDAAFVSFDKLEHFMEETLKGIGIPASDAAIITDVLIESDKRGIDSHGLGRLKPIYIDRIDDGILNPVTRITTISDKATATVLDGNDGMGHVIGHKAMEIAIEKARKFGIGMVAVRNSSHYGIAGYYATMATSEGMIGITGTNARPSIAPTFGTENMLGTNPLTIGLPTDEEFPFVIDAATSVSQRGKIEVYGRAGKEIPPGWVIGEDGKTRTDTASILKDLTRGTAALLPLGGIGTDGAGYKGYGYATAVEILSAALAEGSFMKDLTGKDENGACFRYLHAVQQINCPQYNAGNQRSGQVEHRNNGQYHNCENRQQHQVNCCKCAGRDQVFCGQLGLHIESCLSRSISFAIG